MAEDKKPSLVDYLEECCTANPSPEAVSAVRAAFGEANAPSRMYRDYLESRRQRARLN